MGARNTTKLNSLTRGNDVRIKYLVALPTFQKDIVKIRADFGIKEGGFSNEIEANEWEHNFYEQSQKISKSDKFVKDIAAVGHPKQGFLVDDDMDKFYDFEADFNKKLDGIYSRLPHYQFKKRIKNLLLKCRLPVNFYRYLTDYIVTGRIAAPDKNWDIQFNQKGHKGYSTHISLDVFARLDEKELSKAIVALKTSIFNFLPPQANIPIRVRKHLERDLKIVEGLKIKRREHPVRKKLYEAGGYLSHLEKSGGITPKNRYVMEKMHKNSVTIGYNQPTSKTIGKEAGLKKDATRKVLERADKFAKRLFGVGFDKDTKGNT